MYVKSNPEVYDGLFSARHQEDAAIAISIRKAVSQRIRPKQIEPSPQSFEFHTNYVYRIVITRSTDTEDYAFLLDIGQGLADANRQDIRELAEKQKSVLVLPYNYAYPVVCDGADGAIVSPEMGEEYGRLMVFAACKDAPSVDFGRILAELVAETYIKAIESQNGHFFQVSTEPFLYCHPYR